ncbi:spinster family MFS transporter [Acidocella aquatica]|nr:MFS transporter [Acidocella aquatica]
MKKTLGTDTTAAGILVEKPRKSALYRAWFLLVLTLIYASSFVDRIIIAVIGQPIKMEMNLSDFQVGLLGGFAFSIFYATLGIPVARIADHFNRVKLISATIMAWSVMTALCGTAGVYWQLLLYRLGVGIGEAGSTPTSHSLISDQFTPERRASALALYALGPPIGVIAGALGGGWIAQHIGWRPVFFVAGIPGLALGILAFLTLREPSRDPAHTEVPALKLVLALLFSSRLFIQMLLGVIIAAFAQYAINLFIPIYLIRVFNMPPAHAGLIFGGIVGLGGIIGGALGGPLADWGARYSHRWYALVPAFGTLAAFPLMAFGFIQPDWKLAALLLLLGTIAASTWNGPTFSIVQGLVTPRMRATVSAIVFLLMNLVGQGFGPPAIGFVSDKIAAHVFGAGNYAAVCSPMALKMGATAQLAQACATASATGIRTAMLIFSFILVWGALHYFLAVRHIKKQLV